MKSNFRFKDFSSKTTALLQKFGRGLMLPISILPFAGLLLGIGGAVGANFSHDPTATTVASALKSMSDIVFANLAILFVISIVITFTNDSGSGAFMAILGYLVFNSTQTPFIHFDNDGKLVDIFYFHKGEILNSILAVNLGIKSLQTSLFGAIVVAIVIVVIYNKFKYIQLPNALNFFSGIRFLPILIIPAMFLLSILFLIFWPWVGQGIGHVGVALQKSPRGLDGFIYGVLGRALMPFGLHHIVITLAYQSEFGGVLMLDLLIEKLKEAKLDQVQIDTIIKSFNDVARDGKRLIGDQNIWNFINSISLNKINDIPLFQWFDKELNVNAGRFTQDYPTYLGTCMGIGLAFIFTSNKNTRKQTISVIASAMAVSFLTGITEPLEFTFLFITPVLYYAVYVPFSGLSYLFMNLVGAHVGVGFARGFIDLLVYGALPVLKGTRFYWAFVFALLQGSTIFVIFYFWIIKKDLATPGRKGNELGLISKKDYQKLKTNQKQNAEQRIGDIIKTLGDKTNLESVSACATRLRVVVKDINLVNKEELNKLTNMGFIAKNNNVQVIFGGEATIISDKINEVLKQD